MDKFEDRIQNTIISVENIIRSRMSATEKEHVPNVSDENNANDKRKVMNKDKQFKPKKCMLIKCFCKTYENKVEQKKSNKKYNSLLDNDEVEKGEEDEIKVNGNESIKMKVTVGNNNKNQVKTSNKKK